MRRLLPTLLLLLLLISNGFQKRAIAMGSGGETALPPNNTGASSIGALPCGDSHDRTCIDTDLSQDDFGVRPPSAKMTCIGPWMHPAIPRVCVAEADPRYHAVHAANHRHKRYEADHGHQRHQARPGLIRPRRQSRSSGPDVFVDGSGDIRHPGFMTTHTEDTTRLDADLRACLTSSNLRDDMVNLLLRFAHAAIRITDVPTLERLINLAEIIAEEDEQGIAPSDEHLQRAALLIAAAQLPGACLQDALLGIDGYIDDDDPRPLFV